MSAKSGSLSFVYIQLGLQKCRLYGVAGCPLFRGCLSIEVKGRTVGTFRIVRYIVVSTVEGCPLGRVPLYFCLTGFSSGRGIVATVVTL